jgi:glycosyltransferase involved in cell wall biosynthesis
MSRADETMPPEGSAAVTVIVPAWNEAERIDDTLRHLVQLKQICGSDLRSLQTIVVDDGSTDGTAEHAARWADLVLAHPRNMGKGASLMTGLKCAAGDIVVFLDADLGESARHCPRLWEPLLTGDADMTIARLPEARRKGGVGLARKLAGAGVERLTGYHCLAPLSGQRALRAGLLRRIGKLSGGFGVEVGLTIDAVRLGSRIQELEIPFAHRETGRDLQGWMHRGRQFISIGSVLLDRCWHRTC